MSPLSRDLDKHIASLAHVLGQGLTASYLLGIDHIAQDTASFTDPISLSFDQKPEEAIKYFKKKKLLTKKAFDQLEVDAKSAAFTVSGVYKKQVLSAFKSELSSALRKGTPQKETIKKFKDILAGAGHKQLGDFHLETVFRTNMAMAYGVGRRHGLEAVVDDLPYWEYHAVMDDRVRPTHAALNGMILPANSPFWNDHFPPWGFNCRCTITATDEVPEGYNKANPSGEEGTTVYYDEDGTPAKVEAGTSVYDLNAEGFMGVPPQGGLKTVIEDAAAQANAKTFLEFDDIDEVHEWAKTAFADWKASLTPEEAEAVNFYKGSGYLLMNKYLRGIKQGPAEHGRGQSDFKKHGAALDKAIARGKLPDGIVVHRGLNSPALFNKDAAELKGSPYVDKAYISTSPAIPAAGGFMHGAGPVIMDIKIPAGKTVAYPDLVWQRREAEILLPRGSRFKITSARKEKVRGITALRLTLELL
ncbi:MAG TPA: ADP-ribosyltransferase [Blastocatellia bacterium]